VLISAQPVMKSFNKTVLRSD